MISERCIEIQDEAGMLSLGRRLGSAAGRLDGLVVYLRGNLGAGKTTLVRGWLAGMGHAGRVKSPTYTLLELYDLPDGARLAHMDLYRLTDPEELEFLGVRDLSGWLLVEWPEKGTGHLPLADLEVIIEFLPNEGRLVKLLALKPDIQVNDLLE
jgi:tRNA threonylcarbamoyladenosine biosynthesis protein TsaE